MYFLFTKTLLQPIILGFLSSGMLLLVLWRRMKRESSASQVRRPLRLLIGLYFLAVVMSTDLFGYLMLLPIEAPYPPLKVRPPEAASIVILAGGIVKADDVRLKPELTEDTLVRCLYGAELYHEGAHCPVIVSGGQLRKGSEIPPVAPYMRDLLVRLGVDPGDVLIEDQTSTTQESAVACLKLLQDRGLDRKPVLLVTEASHMGRSLATYRRMGIEAVPAPCHHLATEFPRKIENYLPSVGGVRLIHSAWHEWLGTAWYKLRGWM